MTQELRRREARLKEAVVTFAGLREACEETLRCVQAELHARESPLAAAAGYELAHARLWALHGLSLDTGNHSHARRFEFRVTNGDPLTVCFGYSPFAAPVAGFQRLQTVTTSRWGDVHIPANGCLAIIPEATHMGGRMWRQWCEDCAPSRGQRARALARAHKRIVERL